MGHTLRSNDSVHWFMNDLTSRIIAKSGIPTDRHHLGKIVLQSLKDDPDLVLQIDGGTGQSETNGSALKRSVRCAIGLRNLGLQKGDVMVLMAPNHIDLAVPFYAALYLGVMIAAVDMSLGVQELQNSFDTSRPKIVFCQSDKAPEIQLALNELELNTHIVTFDKGDYLYSFAEFMKQYGDDTPVDDFKPTDFDPENTICLLIATSGTTGLPKFVATTHKNFSIATPYLWGRHTEFPTPTRMALVCSPLQWLTALFHYVLSPVTRYTRLQTSQQLTQEHAYYLINKYRPTFLLTSPTLMSTLLKPGQRDQCDFTCLELVLLGGSAVPKELIQEIKKLTPKAEVLNVYGMSEASLVFQTDFPAPKSCGKPIGCLEYRLIDVEKQEDIYEPNVPGELWLKGPSVFKGYYNNPEETKQAFSDDGWFKTGDLFYRDENWNFFFVERLKMLLKYKSYQISPVEVEGVIRQHPGVLDVAVTAYPDADLNDLVVACVVPRNTHRITAQEIKDMVKSSLSDSKQLRGGVIFLNELPMTPSTKVDRRKLKERVLHMEKE